MTATPQLIADVTARVMKSLNHDRRTIAIHEAGHAVVAWAMGLDVTEATADWTDGHVMMTTPSELQRRSGDPETIAKVFRARLAATVAGSVAVRIAVDKGLTVDQPWQVQPSAIDVQLMDESARWLSELTRTGPGDLTTTAAAKAVDVLIHNWPHVLEIADRLERGKSVWHVRNYLLFRVEREADTCH